MLQAYNDQSVVARGNGRKMKKKSTMSAATFHQYYGLQTTPSFLDRMEDCILDGDFSGLLFHFENKAPPFQTQSFHGSFDKDTDGDDSIAAIRGSMKFVPTPGNEEFKSNDDPKPLNIQIEWSPEVSNRAKHKFLLEQGVVSDTDDVTPIMSNKCSNSALSKPAYGGCNATELLNELLCGGLSPLSLFVPQTDIVESSSLLSKSLQSKEEHENSMPSSSPSHFYGNTTNVVPCDDSQEVVLHQEADLYSDIIQQQKLDAVLKIQSNRRRYLERHKLKTAQGSVLQLQSIWRMYSQRTQYLTMLREIRQDASIEIQRCWKKYSCCKQFKTSRSSVIRIQSVWRQYILRKQYLVALATYHFLLQTETRKCQQQINRILRRGRRYY